MVKHPPNTRLFANKYRVDTVRAKWCEFFQGIYHVTLCTQKRRHYFGEIQCDETTKCNVMHFSQIGQCVDDEIPKIIEHKWYAHAPVWAVMPNHIHILMLIDMRGRLPSPDIISPDPNIEPLCTTALCLDSMDPLTDMDPRTAISERMAEITPKIGSLPIVIRDFKSAITRYANANHIEFAWQSSYDARIIYDQKTLDNVIRYIENNVRNWSNT